ncbi:hypothetical protein D3C85_1613860 [compost metagenome]
MLDNRRSLALILRLTEISAHSRLVSRLSHGLFGAGRSGAHAFPTAPMRSRFGTAEALHAAAKGLETLENPQILICLDEA